MADPALVGFVSPGRPLRSGSRWPASVLTILIAVVSLAGAARIGEHAYVGAALSYDTIGAVEPGSPAAAAGLAPHDRIRAIDGEPVSTRLLPGERLRAFRSGTTHRLRVQRGPRLLDVPLTIGAPPLGEMLWRMALAATGLVCLVIGWTAVWKRPGALTLLFWLVLASFAWLLREPIPTRSLATLTVADTIGDLVQLFLPAFLLHFFVLFPEPRVFVVRRRWVVAVPYAVAVCLAIPTLVGAWWERAGGGVDETLRRTVGAGGAIFLLLAVAGSVALFVHAFVSARTPIARRRLRVALVGTVAGVLPMGVVTLTLAVAPTVALPGSRYAILAFVLVPIAFGYAIVRYQILDTLVIVRRGVIYSIVTALLLAVYLAIVDGIGGMVQSVTHHSSMFFSVASFFLIAILAAPLQGQVQRTVDRIFFRSRYDSVATLGAITHALATLMDVDGLARLVVHRLGTALHPMRAGLYVPNVGRGGDPDGRFASGPLICVLRARWPAEEMTLPAEISTSLAEVAARIGGPIPLERPETGWIELLSAEDRKRCADLHAAVLVPCVAERHPPALLVLGPRRSGEWYRDDDLTLLGAIGDQVGVALANARLSEAQVEAARIERELAVAREIQRRLLPTHTPQLPGYSVAGLTLQAEAVGGDWFDYVPLPDGRTGFVLADVSGHGIPAALVLASLSPVLSAEARKGVPPAALLSQLTRHVAAMDQPERFMACAYAILDARVGHLTISNAGLGAPVLLRADGSILRFESSGPPLGVLAQAPYTDHHVVMRRGDALLLHTDGVAEQPGPDGMYGEDRLLAVLGRLRGQGADAIVAGVLEDLRTYGGPQAADDVTMIVVEACGTDIVPSHAQTGALTADDPEET
jgi:sigma-B regulation protein RsbU (phosphoserine phosphatase)